VVLAFLTLMSVVVPVLYLAPSPAELTYGQAVAIVASFFLGILVLFAYMAHHVYRLRSLSGTPKPSTKSLRDTTDTGPGS
jgi:hypothetical protein